VTVPAITVAALAAAVAVVLGWPGPPVRPRHGGPRPGLVQQLLGTSLRALRPLRRGPAPPVTELLVGLVAELRAGRPTGLALAAAAQDLEPVPCPHALAACRSGSDVAAALRRDAQAPGAHALQGLASCWEVAERSGAGLAAAVGRLAEGMRATAAIEAQLSGEVAAVRTSARLLAALPLLGLAIGQWVGADPLAWLLGSGPGRVVLVLGLGLQGLGMTWLHRMVVRVRVQL
jgi:tight adherence protein B